MHLDQVAVVILNWNGRKLLEQFLPSVTKYSEGTRIIIADNLSTDDSLRFVQQHYPHIAIIRNQDNSGFAKGYNTALKEVDAKYYVLLNSDVEVCEGWIDPVIEHMEKHPEVAACQPKILAWHNKHLFEYAGACGGFIDKYGYPFCRGRIFTTLEEDKGQYDMPMEIHWATGACMFVRADVFKEKGGFDEDYFAHMEEIDLCWRMKNSGYRIMVIPQSKVYHVGGGTLNKISPQKTYLNFRNNLITLTKNHADSYLLLKIIIRLKLDAIAAFKFLFEGSPGHFIAVIKAHFAYYSRLPATLKKRRKLKSEKGYTPATSGILSSNIVLQYYLKGKKKFADL